MSLNRQNKEIELCPRIYVDILSLERVNSQACLLVFNFTPTFTYKVYKSMGLVQENILSMTYAKTCEKGHFGRNNLSCQLSKTFIHLDVK